MRSLRIPLLLLSVLILAGWGVRFLYESAGNRELESLLQHRQLSEARAMLNGYHDWNVILQKIEATADATLAQAAFDVQFENWYSEKEDTNYSYPEHADVLHRLLLLGARGNFDHLLRATRSNQMKTARMLLDAGAPVQRTGASESPLAEAAYWGDLDLVERLLQHGAGVNGPPDCKWPPLLAAAWSCKLDCVRRLLKEGADVTLPHEVWAGAVRPLWTVVEEPPVNGGASLETWNLIRAKGPASR